MKDRVIFRAEFDATKGLCVDEIKITWPYDSPADLSDLGKFTDDITNDAIIRYGEHKGKSVAELDLDNGYCFPERRAGEYRFFLPAMTGEQTGNPESPQQDWQRAEAYELGMFSVHGCVCEAVVSYSIGQGSRRMEKFVHVQGPAGWTAKTKSE